MRFIVSGGLGPLARGLCCVALLASSNAWAQPAALNWIPSNGTATLASTLSRIGGDGFTDID